MRFRRQLIKFFRVAGLPIFEPFVRLAAGEDPRAQLKEIGTLIVVPMLAVCLFLAAWSLMADSIKTNSGQLPGPAVVGAAGRDLWNAHWQQRTQDAALKQEKRAEAVAYLHAARRAQAEAATLRGNRQSELLRKAQTLEERALALANYTPTSAPTFIDQTINSLWTVFAGFLVATMIAIPLGIICGMSPLLNAALSPLIQVFKPVSPLAWLPIVSVIIGWMYFGHAKEETLFPQAFLISAVTVSLCSLWPTLVNTALGVASVNNDYLNVAKVLRLSWWQKLTKIILPASLPLMFAGLRISLGVGWMVLVAADMLAQNPGLGKFVWDMFQNGSRDTMAKIMFAVFVIGILGLVLDRVMVCLRNLVSFDLPQAG